MTWALAQTQSGTLVVTPLKSVDKAIIALTLISTHDTMVEAWAALQHRRGIRTDEAAALDEWARASVGG